MSHLNFLEIVFLYLVQSQSDSLLTFTEKKIISTPQNLGSSLSLFISLGFFVFISNLFLERKIYFDN